MDFPFGHHNNHNHNHHHNNRRDDDESESYPPPQFPSQPPFGGAYPHPPSQNYPPPPSYGEDFPHAPPQHNPYGGAYSHAPPENYPGVQHVSHNPDMEYQNYQPPPQPPHVAGVQHISHNTPHMESPNEYGGGSYGGGSYGGGSYDGGSHGGGHHFRPHMPSFMGGGGVHGGGNGNEIEGYFGNRQSCKMNCKAGGGNFCVGIRDGKVVLCHEDPNDLTQHWYKDEKYSTKVKDEDGYPSFALVNKGTGQAMKHPVSGEPVELIPFKPDHLDASILWTESKDLGSGFRTIRNVNNVHMVLDAFNGDKDHGGVHDGTFLSTFKCWKGDNQNQQWKIFPH